MGEKRHACIIFVGEPEIRGTLGRPRHRARIIFKYVLKELSECEIVLG
jgi:hypothetical protein